MFSPNSKPAEWRVCCAMVLLIRLMVKVQEADQARRDSALRILDTSDWVWLKETLSVCVDNRIGD